MRKTAIRICIAVIVVCLVLAIAMICMAFMSEKKEYQPASSGKQSTQTETTVMATLRPTPAVTAEPTAEPPVDNVNGVEVPSWPKSPDTRIGICFTDSAANSLAQPALFAGLNEGMGMDYEKANNWVMTNASSVEAVSGFVYDDTFDAILIFPTEGVEYKELVWDAYKSGKAVQFITSEEPKEVFEQVCRIYGKTDIKNPYSEDAAELVQKPLPEWPADPKAKIGIAYTTGAWSGNNGECRAAVHSALAIVTGRDFSGTKKRVESSWSGIGKVLPMMKNDGVEAVMIFPVSGMDYTPVYEYAAENGIALHMFSSEDPVVIFNEICALYGKKLDVPQQPPFLGADEVSSAISSAFPTGLQNSIQWSTHDDPWFYCFFPSGQNIMFDELRSAIMDVANGTKNRELCGEGIAAAEWDWSVLEKYGDVLKDFEGIFVIPQDGVDYSPLEKWCAENNMPLYFFEADTRQEIRAELIALYA